jgi:general secretion pathway protein H
MATLPVGSSRGFSLLELLVVLAIIGLLLTLTPLVFSGTIDRLRLESTARELASALRVTRARAISLQTPQALAVYLEAPHYQGPANPEPRTLPAEFGYQLIVSESERLGPKGGSIRFYPDGSSTGGRIEVRAAGADWAVDVDWLTGRVALLE